MKKSILKRGIGIVLSLLLVCSLLPATAMADEGDIAMFAAGTVLSSAGGTLESGEYYLDGDVTLTEDITIPEDAEVVIDLNGHKLKGTGDHSVITNNGTFTLNDGSGNDSGELTGSTSEDNYVERGGGVCNNGDFTMNGGKICNNTVLFYGAGVYNSIYGTFTMTGGEISGNTSPVDEGGGVFNANEFIMTGGKISENFAAIGGGVYMNRDSCVFTMTGGEISGNSVYDNGAGVCANRGTFIMTDSVIRGNSAPYKDSTGGGVYIGNSCTFIMAGTIIVEDNDCAGTENNFYLPSDCQIGFAGALTAGSSIGVTTAAKPTAENPVPITGAESDTDYYEASAQYFFSDEGYDVQINESGHYLELTASGESSLNGLHKDSDGVWRYYENGVAANYTGFAENENGQWYVEKGVVTFNMNSVCKDTTGALGEVGAWYYVVGSKVQNTYTGVANYKNENGWWYVKNGKVDLSHKGVDKNSNGWW